MLRQTHLLLAGITAAALSGCGSETPEAKAATSAGFLEPRQVLAKNGTLDSPLHVVFDTAPIPGATKDIIQPATTATEDNEIFVRRYILPNAPVSPSAELIPGPTFVFQPGDLLRIRFQNRLNRSSDPRLNDFQNNPQIGRNPAAGDDTDEHVSHEISIPNDSDVTNLHVHGLHVDPKQDDVTLLILPQDSDPSGLVPELQRFVPNINRWWSRRYQYKIPLDHLPGTYWYHAHKHGSTSTQVENGMAGTLHMRPRDEESTLIPGLWNADPSKSHDRIMVLQQIANYGVRQGRTGGGGKGRGRGRGNGRGPGGGGVQPKKANLTNGLDTVNGQYQPTLRVPASQVERWRFVFAGANHMTSSYLWVGRAVPKLTQEAQDFFAGIKTMADYNKALQAASRAKDPTSPIPIDVHCHAMPGVVKIVAADGINLWQPRDVTPANPAMGSAGNRLDFVIQPNEKAKTLQTSEGQRFRLYRNYPVDPAPLAAKYPKIFGAEATEEEVRARLAAITNTNLAVVTPRIGDSTKPIQQSFSTDPYRLGTDFSGMTVPWPTVGSDGSPLPVTKSNPLVKRSLAPILRGLPKGKGVVVDPNFAQSLASDARGWQPQNGGGRPLNPSVLIKLDLEGTATGVTKLPSDFAKRAASLSPAGPEATTKLKRVDPSSRQLVDGVPSYVAPIQDSDIVGRQVTVFDRAQFTFNYVNKASQTQQNFRQFWINGRQFSVNDWIGNPKATQRIEQPLENVESSLGDYDPSDAENLWTHRDPEDTTRNIVTNPGYFKPVVQTQVTDEKSGKVQAYSFDYKHSKKAPSYKDITGLTAPVTPKATTAEEWLLVNNSDIFHPFHIHISPFFVTEIGQLNFDTATKKWTLHKLTLADKADPNKPFSWVVGNWWDVITIPPHGYVRMRTWINVPSQMPVDSEDPNSDLVVHDNTNVYGSWVMHCHILRHEDRGMMSLVNTEPKQLSLQGTWSQDGGPIFKIQDDHGGLVVTEMATRKTFRGFFNRGVGNPLLFQPMLGSFNRGSITSFCVEAAGKTLVLSDGHLWTRTDRGTPPLTKAKIDLSGDWKDPSDNLATIKQTGGGTAQPFSLTFTPDPKTPVWWATGTGSWNPSKSNQTVFYGTQHLKSHSGQNQQINFTISADGSSIYFGNGVVWQRSN